LIAFLGWLATLPTYFQAQQQGNNAVFVSSTFGPSSAFIDASAFVNKGEDICKTINDILKSKWVPYPTTGAVVDARGFVPLSVPPPNNQPCGTNPFDGVTVPSTILLPTSTIQTSATWVLPSNTRIVGTGFKSGIAATFTSGDVIDMCSSTASTPCSGVSIEHLTVQGLTDCPSTTTSNTLNGIVNYYAQSSSDVDDVGICDIGGISLEITSNAANSGPYSNLNIPVINRSDNYSCSGGLGSCPTCVDLEAQTHGLHGMTCIGTPGVAGNATSMLTHNGDAGVYVNASNNTVEDVHIEGFFDGVEVGDTTTAVGNIFLGDITGGFSGNGRTRNTIHICGSNFPSGSHFGKCQNYPPTGTPPNRDVTIFGVTDGNNGGGTGDNGSTVIQDDVTNTSVAAPSGSGTGVMAAVYALGEQAGNGDSRFSTSPSSTNSATGATMVPTWGVGQTSSVSSCNTPGAVYSNTAGSGTNTSIYVCTYSGRPYAWSPIM